MNSIIPMEKGKAKFATLGEMNMNEKTDILNIISELTELKNRISKLSSVKIQSGDWKITDGRETPNDLSVKNKKTKELRSLTRKIHFDSNFEKIPQVNIGFSQFGTDSSEHDIRISVEAKNVTPNGFDIYVYTWDESLVYEFNVQWLAYTN